MAAQLKVIVDWAVGGEKLLGMPGGFEPLHMSLMPSKVIERSVEAAARAGDAYHCRHRTTPPDILTAEPEDAAKATSAATPKRCGLKATRDDVA